MTPTFYTFRRCPYAMRARLALAISGVSVELREIVLRDKPAAFLKVSASATVPCLVTPDKTIDESFDIMIWALRQNDPEDWLMMPDEGYDWVRRADGPFKEALDHTKYATRYPDVDVEGARARACAFLRDLDAMMDGWMFARPTLADYAILPFVRQFAFIDKAWFDAQEWPDLQCWLDRFLTSEQFAKCMLKYCKWQEGDAPVVFP